MPMITHITTHADWKAAVTAGKYSAASLKSEGFIHCSTVRQFVDTANIFFKGQKGLALLCIDEKKLASELKFEPPTGGGAHDPGVGALFPHVYGPINLDAVITVVDFPSTADGSFKLPREVAAMG
jgi:uncharacterized protein (DUF952 family)